MQCNEDRLDHRALAIHRMISSSIKEYLKHYGKIRSLRGSVIRSTFRRVTAAFDTYNEVDVDVAMRELGVDPLALTCVYCSAPADCWDHLIPAAKGGTHQLRNLAPACTSCNTRKGDKTWSAYFESIPNTPENSARKTILEKFTISYEQGASLLNDPDHERLNKILDRIHQAMTEADEIVAQAIAKRLTAKQTA